MDSRQVFTLPDRALGTCEYLLGRKSGEGFQPQPLGVVQGLYVGKGRVELIVVPELEQAKYFVQGAFARFQFWITSLCL